MKSNINQIQKIAVALQPDLLRFLQEIVAIPSLSGKEGAVVLRIKKEMEQLDYDEIRIDNLGNLLGRIGNGPRLLALDGHCDTVDVGNPSLWQGDPFAAEIIKDKLYGRGACDQKGGLAGAVYAGRVLKEIGVPPEVTVWVVASVQEEDCEGLPWKFIIVEDGIRPEAVLLTEPTNLNIYRGHRGRLEIKVKTEGVSCHGSAPERGVNAIYKMAPLIQEIEVLHERLRHDPFLGKGSLTVAEIRSTAPSLCAVADSCRIHLDRRLTADETIETSLAEIKSLPSFGKTNAKVWVPEYRMPSYRGREYPMQSYFPTWTLPQNHFLVKTAVQSYRRQFALEPKVDKWIFSTNGIATMGLFRIPTIGFGPGDESVAHSPNENIPVDHLAAAVRFYAQFCLDLAGSAV